MNKIKYQLKLWQIRASLQKKAIHKPVDEMVKRGMIQPDTKYKNYLLGRVQNLEFLRLLDKLDNLID